MEYNDICAISLLIIISFGVYLNTLQAEFVYDDSRAILTNYDLMPETPWINLLKNDYWGTDLSHSGSHKSYRPLTTATFRLNYLFSQLKPRGYHFVNIALHSIATVLVWVLARKFYRNQWTILFCGLFFALHPIHTEAVAGVVGRADILSTIFFLISLLSYMRHLVIPNRKWTYFLQSLICATLAMLSKEHGITVVAVCAFYDLFYHSRISIEDLFRLSFMKQTRHHHLRKRLILLFVFTSVCILFRLWIMNFQGPEFSPSDNPAAHENLFLTRFLTFSFLPFFNTKLLILPHHLSFDWSMDAIPLVYSCWDPRTFLSMIFYVVLAYNSVKLIKICNRNVASPSPTFDINDNPLKSIPNNNNSIIRPLCSEPKCAAPIKNGYKLKFKGSNLVLLSDYSYLSDTVLFGIVITVITFLPATNLLTYVGFVVAERVLYLPSVGYCMMVAAGMERLMVSKRYKKLVTVMSLLLLVVFATKTVKRNRDWKNEENLYSSGITVNPAKAYSNLGNVLSRQDRNDEAETAYKNALKYRPNMADTHYNLGHLLQQQGRLLEAIESYETAIQCRSQLAVAHLNLGLALWTQGKLSEAESRFKLCSQLTTDGLKDPKSAENAQISCLYNLGRLYAEQSLINEAIKMYELAVNRLTSHYASIPSLYNMLGEAHAKANKLDLAEKWYTKALEAKADHIPALLTFGHLRLKQGKIEESEEWFLKAHNLSPKDPSPLQHLGQFYHQIDQVDKSLDAYNRAYSLDDRIFDISFALANLYRQKGENNESEKFYARSVAINPESANARANYGAILHVNKKYEQAQEQYWTALKLNPNDQLTKDNYEKLKRVMTK